MRNQEIFSFSLEGLEVMTKKLDQITEDIDKRLEETLTKLAFQVMSDAQALAPFASGDLEGSFFVDDVKRSIAGLYVEIGTGVPYAAAQHEGFRKTEDGRIIQFSPGPGTLDKGNHKGYPAGKKFLENALKINEKLIVEELSKVLRP
jgi:HK97 gp10 family phage protein